MEEALPATASEVIASDKLAEQVIEGCGSSGCIDFPYLAGAFAV